MTQRNEKELVEARKLFYQNTEVKDKWLKIGEFAGTMYDVFIINHNCGFELENFRLYYTCHKNFELFILQL